MEAKPEAPVQMQQQLNELDEMEASGVQGLGFRTF